MELLRRINLALPVRKLALDGQVNRDGKYQLALAELEFILHNRVSQANMERKSNHPKICYFQGLPLYIVSDRTNCLSQVIDNWSLSVPQKFWHPYLITSLCFNEIGLTLLYQDNEEDAWIIWQRQITANLQNWLSQPSLFLDEIKLPPSDLLDLQSENGVKTAIERVKGWEIIDTFK